MLRNAGIVSGVYFGIVPQIIGCRVHADRPLLELDPLIVPWSLEFRHGSPWLGVKKWEAVNDLSHERICTWGHPGLGSSHGP